MGGIKIGIIGAGLTGLVAAKELSKKGLEVTIFEKMDHPGGKMRTEIVDGWKLDTGFQFLLTSYPYLTKHIDLSKIKFLTLDSAVSIFREGRKSEFGDPFKTKSIFWKTAFSDVGSFKDKRLILKLKKQLDGQSISEIFKTKKISTLEFLNDFGFSDIIIERFFKPFYGGIFFENELKTSSRMFLFTFKMIANGKTKIPLNGIGTVARLLEVKLDKVNFNYNCEVSKIEGQTVFFNDGKTESFDYVINTAPNLGGTKIETPIRDNYNLYFEHKSPAIISQPRIGLNANPNRLINSIFCPSIYQDFKKNKRKSLISITVLNTNGIKEKELIEKVGEELESDFNVKAPRFVKLYSLPSSLSRMDDPKNDVQFNVEDKTFNVGRYLMNDSHNAACKVGGLIAKHLIKIEDL